MQAREATVSLRQAERRGNKADVAPVMSLNIGLDDEADDKSGAKSLMTGSSPGPASPVGGGGSDAEAVFNMVNAILGAGVLGWDLCCTLPTLRQA